MNNNSGDLFFEPLWALEYGSTSQKEYRLKTGTTRANTFLRQIADSLMMYVH